MVDGVEEIPRELAREIRALAVHVLGEGAQERVLVISQPPVQLAVGEVTRGVSVHGIEDHGNSTLMRGLHETLHVGAIAEALVDAEVADGQKSPVHGHGYIRHRHDLEAIDAEIREIVEPTDGAIDAVGELIEHQLIDDEIAQMRRFPGKLARGPGMRLVIQRDGGKFADAVFTREGISYPVDRTDIRVADLESIHIRALRAPGRSGRGGRAAREHRLAGPVVAMHGVHRMRELELGRGHGLDELIAS